MARTIKQSRTKASQADIRSQPFHSFWSGSVSFGLVNVPVLVYPANRHSGIRLHLMSPDGSLVERQYFCPQDGKVVRGDELVRGFELEDGSYITVDERELETIEPQKSREIDLREFIDLAELPLPLLERGYYLTPLKEASKAYRLLAEIMERTGRAGIATFVMRDRECLVAIFARNGILCAETLRFEDEIRTPQAVGLPAPITPARQHVAAFERSIDALSCPTISRTDLTDKATDVLRELIEKKIKAGKDLVRTDYEPDENHADAEEDVDLLETIRRSLRHSGNSSTSPHRTSVRSSKGLHQTRNGRGAVGKPKKKPAVSKK